MSTNLPWEDQPPVAPNTHQRARTFEPGLRGVWMTGGVLVLLVAMLLPHTGSASGFDVLSGSAASRDEAISLPSRLFLGATLLFPVALTAVALTVRRWPLAWVATAGSGLTSAFGLLAVWSRQTVGATSTAAGPGLGLLVMWVVVVLLTFHWVRLVWTQIPASSDERSAEFTPKLRQDL